MQDHVQPKKSIKDEEEEFWQPTYRLNIDESTN